MNLPIFLLIEVLICVDMVVYRRYRQAIPGTLVRRRLSIAFQLTMLCETLAWIVWAVVAVAESHPWWAVWNIFVAALNIFLWRTRGYDDDLWNSTKRGAKRLAKRLRSAIPRRSSVLRPAGGLS